MYRGFGSNHSDIWDLTPSLFSLCLLKFMATRRRTSATRKTAKTATVKESTISVKKVTPTRAKRVNKVTQPAKSIVTEVTETPKVEVKDVKQEVKSLPNFSQLRGLDFVIVPLIYLEAFVVNILHNLDVKVPESVSLR